MPKRESSSKNNTGTINAYQVLTYIECKEIAHDVGQCGLSHRMSTVMACSPKIGRVALVMPSLCEEDIGHSVVVVGSVFGCPWFALGARRTRRWNESESGRLRRMTERDKDNVRWMIAMRTAAIVVMGVLVLLPVWSGATLAKQQRARSLAENRSPSVRLTPRDNLSKSTASASAADGPPLADFSSGCSLDSRSSTLLIPWPRARADRQGFSGAANLGASSHCNSAANLRIANVRHCQRIWMDCLAAECWNADIAD